MFTNAHYLFIGVIVFIALQRIIELRIAKRNEQWAREQGAQEYGAGHYPLFFVLHGGWAFGWILESVWNTLTLSSLWILWLSVFVLAQCIRYGAIRSLGRYWNTRILVIEGHTRVRQGIYRWIPHPNYLAVALELASIPLLFQAYWTAGIATCLNALLLLCIRIPTENQALNRLK